MHERTRRAVARLLFMLVCALPTSVTGMIIIVTFTPWFAAYRLSRLETELSLRIGLTVKIDSVDYPAPATIRLTGVRLLEPETESEVAKVRLVTWVNTEEKTAVQLLQPELQSAMLPFAWRVIHDRFLCQPELTDQPVRMAANDLTIHSRSGSLTFRDVDSWLRPVADGVEAIIQGIPANRDDSAPIHLSVTRDRSGSVPTTDWTMNTGDIPLVCSALAEYLPAMKVLGSDATFTGTLRWNVSNAGWNIDLGGARFDNVDLGELMRGTAHRVSGRAAIRLETCKIAPGSEFDLSGTLIGSGGFVGQSFIQELQKQLQFEIAPMIEGDTRDWPFETLAVRFDLIGSNMTLEGICNRQRGHERLPDGIVFASGVTGICKSPATRQTWVGLVRTLWPDGGETLPISTQTSWLFKYLPPPRPGVLDGPTGRNELPRITAASEIHNGPIIDEP
jgi:hypothetical protein